MKDPIRQDALRSCVQAVISLDGGIIRSMAHLASIVTKCSRFLFLKEMQYHRDMYEEITALEAQVVLELAGDIVNNRKQRSFAGFDVDEEGKAHAR